VDSEIIVHLLAQPAGSGGHESTLVNAVRRIEGAYSLVILTENELIGVARSARLPPARASAAWRNGAFVLSSETTAPSTSSRREFVRDVEPGEIVIIDDNGPALACRPFRSITRRAFCIFEYVYFARPDSDIGNRNVYGVRVEMGRQLAREHNDRGRHRGARARLRQLRRAGLRRCNRGIPFEMAFVRNHYVGRSFLQPSQFIRDFNVRVKLNLIGDLVQRQARHHRGRLHRARHHQQGRASPA
jgi:amidophosphoribosyltransferase